MNACFGTRSDKTLISWKALTFWCRPTLWHHCSGFSARLSISVSFLHTPNNRYCDGVSHSFRNLFESAGVEFDDFVRTTEPRHAEVVRDVWRRLNERGYIYKGEYVGWYCVSDEEFLTPAQVISSAEWARANGSGGSGGSDGAGGGDESESSAGDTSASGSVRPGESGDSGHVAKTICTGAQDMVSALTGHPVIEMREENYMFRLSEFALPLQRWLDETPSPVQPSNRLSAVRNLVAGGLDDLSVSRHRRKQPWGIEVPGDPEHTVYVWLDALVNYITVR